jgi:translation initiation factor IF-1
MINTKIIAAGTVIDFLPDACFRVELDNGVQIGAHASVKLRDRAYYISPGNRVTIHISPFNMKNVRITTCIENQSENKSK